MKEHQLGDPGAGSLSRFGFVQMIQKHQLADPVAVSLSRLVLLNR